MPKKNFLDEYSEKRKKRLGELIKQTRGELSLRKITEHSSLSASNLQYIEQGVNAPTAETYELLIKRLHPDSEIRAEMDECYMAIRKIPPPDVCKTVMNTSGFVDALREFDGQPITDSQVKELRSLLASFAETSRKEKANYAEDL